LAAAIVRYACDAGLRQRQGDRARERVVTEFSIETMLTNYQKLYDHTLNTAEA
jgi:hypothetical protein